MCVCACVRVWFFLSDYVCICLPIKCIRKRRLDLWLLLNAGRG